MPARRPVCWTCWGKNKNERSRRSGETSPGAAAPLHFSCSQYVCDGCAGAYRSYCGKCPAARPQNHRVLQPEHSLLIQFLYDRFVFVGRQNGIVCHDPCTHRFQRRNDQLLRIGGKILPRGHGLHGAGRQPVQNVAQRGVQIQIDADQADDPVMFAAHGDGSGFERFPFFVPAEIHRGGLAARRELVQHIQSKIGDGGTDPAAGVLAVDDADHRVIVIFQRVQHDLIAAAKISCQPLQSGDIRFEDLLICPCQFHGANSLCHCSLLSLPDFLLPFILARHRGN